MGAAAPFQTTSMGKPAPARVDFRTSLKVLYTASPEVLEVSVPRSAFLAIDGAGQPGAGVLPRRHRPTTTAQERRKRQQGEQPKKPRMEEANHVRSKLVVDGFNLASRR